MARILIVDDEEGIREILTEILADEGHQVHGCGDGNEALEMASRGGWDLVFLDVWLPGKGGLEVLQSLRTTHPDLPVVMISGHARIEQAVQAVKMGAYDFIEKPLSLERIVLTAERALGHARLKRENAVLKNRLFVEDPIVGQSATIRQVLEKIEQAARVDSRVLILGENGTGKELVARAIHLASSRSDKPFIEVNCAAIPDTLLESELFGHEKGAFTGAVGQRRGKWELADGGTLFLDEIGDLSPSAQAKVLRAVQESQFMRVGGQESIRVNVRIIAATNKNLKQEVAEGRFREDLFYRLDVLQIHVPPLRERVEDIPLLADYFLEKFAARDRRPKLQLDPGALEALCRHPWPGNVRELRNVCERLAIYVDEPVARAEDVLTHLEPPDWGQAEETPLSFRGMTLQEAKACLERYLITQALRESQGNLTRAAQSLGLYPSALVVKMKRLGIEKP